MVKAVIFDMDGTILNTLDDLTDAINYALKLKGHKCDFSALETRMFFGSGIGVAFERALAYEQGCKLEELEYIGSNEHADIKLKYRVNPSDIEDLLKIYKPYYDVHCNDKTCAYKGIHELIKELRTRGIKTAVVSNKPDSAVKILCDELFAEEFDFNLGELPNLNRKPARDMIDISLEALKVDTSEAIYMGDSEIDLLTAQNAEMPCIAVTWGFRGRRFLENHGATMIIDEPSEAIQFLL